MGMLASSSIQATARPEEAASAPSVTRTSPLRHVGARTAETRENPEVAQVNVWSLFRSFPGGNTMWTMEVKAGRQVELERLYREEGNRLWWALLAYSGDREVASD